MIAVEAFSPRVEELGPDAARGHDGPGDEDVTRTRPRNPQKNPRTTSSARPTAIAVRTTPGSPDEPRQPWPSLGEARHGDHRRGEHHDQENPYIGVYSFITPFGSRNTYQMPR